MGASTGGWNVVSSNDRLNPDLNVFCLDIIVHRILAEKEWNLV